MATYGYARVSTRGQAKDGNSLESQNKLLKENGAEKIFSDCFTGTKLDRPEFDKLLSILKPGDKLIVTKLDRFARTARQGMELISSLLEKEVSVHVLNMGLIDNTPTGKLITQVLLAFSEFERDLIVERTAEGKMLARRKPNYREGRPRKYSDEQLNYALLILEDHSYAKTSQITGVSKSSLIRAKKARLSEKCTV